MSNGYHPFDGPEVFDDSEFREDAATLEALDPWPNVSAAVRDLLDAKSAAQ
jgi:hypothetical protein